jgi:hypothetical protein
MGTWGWIGLAGLAVAAVVTPMVLCGGSNRRGGSSRVRGRSRSTTTKFVVSKDRKMDSQRKIGVTYMKEAARLQLTLAKFLAQNRRKEAKSIVSKLARLEEKINKLRLRGAALAA